MHILGILVFVLALIVAGEVIRSTLSANGEKIFAALMGEMVETGNGPVFSNICEPASVIPIIRAERRCVVSRPVSLPLAA